MLVPVSPRHEATHKAEKRTLLRMEFATYIRGFHPDAVSDRAGWRTVDLPDAILEPVARRFPTIGRAAARVLAVLRDQSPKSGSGCPDP